MQWLELDNKKRKMVLISRSVVRFNSQHINICRRHKSLLLNETHKVWCLNVQQMCCHYAPTTNDSDCITWCFPSQPIKEKRSHQMNQKAFSELICSLYIFTILMTTMLLSISMKISVHCWHIRILMRVTFKAQSVTLRGVA